MRATYELRPVWDFQVLEASGLRVPQVLGHKDPASPPEKPPRPRCRSQDSELHDVTVGLLCGRACWLFLRGFCGSSTDSGHPRATLWPQKS